VILQEAASISPAGSAFMASIITEESLQWMQKSSAEARQAAASAAAAGAAAAPGRAKGPARESLTSKFIWGCPGDVAEVGGWARCTARCCDHMLGHGE
jgi:hypothetical protein